MELLYCGDRNAEDGILISLLSVLKQETAEVHVRVLTMECQTSKRAYRKISPFFAGYLDKLVKEKNPENWVRLYDMTSQFKAEPPAPNMETRFSPLCMLRLYVDLLDDLPDRLLYLDTDVVARAPLDDLYNTDMEGYEIAGVLDYYGRWFFHHGHHVFDYLNSGVLVMNMVQIRKTGLLKRCRHMCATQQLFMPDQSALNKLAVEKKLLPRKYNEQRRLHRRTILQHFTTSFRFLPWLHAVTVKPWQVDRMHDILHLHAYDDLLSQYAYHMSAIRSQGEDPNV
ncbi:MAG: glycosyltransferase [Sphaerochaetaceae bacterium]|nr:glycosyltransferase [Spirochaetales bacterium]MDY5499312.1 glycosyltransferase [Sphaerochaetaceae bacterium]